MEKILGLAAGSVAGGVARWLVADWLRHPRFPYGTLAVNLSGCLLVGLLHGLGESRLSPGARLLLVTGFCGAFTTFSAWILESSSLLDRGDWRSAAVNIAGSVVLGLALFRAGQAAGRLV